MVLRSQANGARANYAAAKSMPPLIEVRFTNERGAFSRRSPKRCAALAPVNHGPVDHDLLTVAARLFHKQDRDVAVVAGADGLRDLVVGDCRGVAMALQLKFLLIDAARYVCRQHQQQIYRLNRTRRRAC